MEKMTPIMVIINEVKSALIDMPHGYVKDTTAAFLMRLEKQLPAEKEFATEVWDAARRFENGLIYNNPQPGIKQILEQYNKKV